MTMHGAGSAAAAESGMSAFADVATQGIIVRTLADRIFEIVRERIVTGALPVDLPIRQDALATDLGVSKIPLREALGRLEQEGLLVSQANRGYTVRPMSAGEADEIYALRLSIEPEAAARAARYASDRDRADARDAFVLLDEAGDAPLAEYAIRNRCFHVALVRPGGRLLTTQVIERLSIMAERYVIAHLQPSGRDARALMEHRALMDAWMARDEPTIRDLLHRHIEGTLHDLRAEFAAGDS